MTSKWIIFSVLIMLLSVSLLSAAIAATAPIVTDEEADAWIEDLDYLADQLPKLHKNAFHSTTEAEFDSAVSTLRSAIPTMTENQIRVELAKLVSLIKDSHTATSLYGADLRLFPIQIVYFSDGPRVIATHPDYMELLGSTPIKIEDTLVSLARGMLEDVVFTDNMQSADKMIPNLLVYPVVLNGLGIIADPTQATWMFQFENGKIIDVPIVAMPMGDTSNWEIVVDENSPTPMYRQQPRNPYYYIHNPDLKLLYVQYNSCMERDDLSFKDFSAMLMKAIEENDIEKFVIDLRFNAGGNSAIADPLIRKLSKTDKVNQKGKIFVITGGNTFSSAVLNAIALRKKTEAIFVGKPTGGRPNHFGEIKRFTLPNSGLSVSYSTKYFVWVDEDTDALYPDMEIGLTYHQFITAQDPALEWILTYK